MLEIFLSYSSEDRERVIPLIEALQQDGYSLWWDREIRPGPSFDREIEKALDEARCVVVVWSANSVESEWVRSEVEEGVRQGILIPVLLDDVMPPLAYRRRQSADLSVWKGERDGEYAKLITGIEATLAGEQAPENHGANAGHGVASVQPRRRRRQISVLLASTLVLAALALGFLISWFAGYSGTGSTTPNASPMAKFEIQLPADVRVSGDVGSPLVITPDGQNIVFNGVDKSGNQQYYLRSLDELTTEPIPGIVENRSLGSVWGSQDGKWIVFNHGTERVYKKVRISGGTPVSVAATGLSSGGGIRGLSWASNGDIIFANIANPGLMIVSNGSGEAKSLTEPEEDYSHSEPFYLPDGNAVLFEVQKEEAPGMMIVARDLQTGQEHELVDGGEPRVTSSGHLLFFREGVVWATAFDRERLAVYGEQVPVLEGVKQSGDGYSTRGFDVADNGTLVYTPVDALEEGRDARLVWVNLEGVVEEIPGFLPNILMPRLSPDDQQIVTMNFSENRVNLWTYAFGKQMTTRLSFDANFDIHPAWTPDGKQIVYTTGIGNSPKFDLMIRAADGTGQAKRLTENGFAFKPSVAPDGKTVIFTSCEAQCDIARVMIGADEPYEVLLETGFNEQTPVISPDGRWLAYVSDESGRPQVYVRPYPNLEGGRWQVSTNGGEFPVWSETGSRLYYAEASEHAIMSVEIDHQGAFSAGRPTPLIDISPYEWKTNRNDRNFDIGRDGKRFLMTRAIKRSTRLVIVLNWLDEVERLVPLK